MLHLIFEILFDLQFNLLPQAVAYKTNLGLLHNEEKMQILKGSLEGSPGNSQPLPKSI